MCLSLVQPDLRCRSGWICVAGPRKVPGLGTGKRAGEHAASRVPEGNADRRRYDEGPGTARPSTRDGKESWGAHSVAGPGGKCGPATARRGTGDGEAEDQGRPGRAQGTARQRQHGYNDTATTARQQTGRHKKTGSREEPVSKHKQMVSYLVMTLAISQTLLL